MPHQAGDGGARHLWVPVGAQTWKLAGFANVVADIRDETTITIFLKALNHEEVHNIDFFITLA